MRIVICDDDKAFAMRQKELVVRYLQEHDCQAEITVYHDGETLLQDRKQIDIVLLDVEMPGINGIYVGRDLMARNPYMLIMVVTSYSDYLDEAMRCHVFRYISKPVDPQRLYRNLQEAIQQYITRESTILVETGRDSIVQRTTDIIMIKTEGRDVYVCTEQSAYCTLQPMKFWIEKLNQDCFFSTHRGFIVNMRHVERYDHEQVYMDDGSVAYLARRKYQTFRKAFLMYLEGAGV